jgi:hypothetical protein
MVKPVAARADFGAVEGALERVASVQMQAITRKAAMIRKVWSRHSVAGRSPSDSGSSRATWTCW